MALAALLMAAAAFLPVNGTQSRLMAAGLWFLAGAVLSLAGRALVVRRGFRCPSCLRGGVFPPWGNQRPYYCPECGARIRWSGGKEEGGEQEDASEEEKEEDSGQKEAAAEEDVCLRLAYGRLCRILTVLRIPLLILVFFLDGAAKLAPVLVLFAAEIVGEEVSQRHLRCPHCGKRPAVPGWSRDSVTYCSECGGRIHWK